MLVTDVPGVLLSKIEPGDRQIQSASEIEPDLILASDRPIRAFAQRAKGESALGQRPGKASAKVVVAIAGRVAVTVRRPAVLRTVAPIAATYDAVRAPTRTSIGVVSITRIVLAILVPDPIFNIAAHVLQTPEVWLLLTDRMRHPTRSRV